MKIHCVNNPKVFTPFLYLDGDRLHYRQDFLECMRMYFQRLNLKKEFEPYRSCALTLIQDEIDNCLDESDVDGFLFQEF